MTAAVVAARIVGQLDGRAFAARADPSWSHEQRREAALDACWRRLVVEGGADPLDWQEAVFELTERGRLTFGAAP